MVTFKSIFVSTQPLILVMVYTIWW